MDHEMYLTSLQRANATRRSSRIRITSAFIGAWLLAASLFVFVISDTLLALNIDSSMTVKLAAFGLLGLAIAVRPSFHRKITLILPLIAIMLLSFTRAYNDAAGLEEFLRFLFPLVITIALFAYRDQLGPIVRVFFFIVITNDLYQLWAYLAIATGLPQFVPVRIDSGLFLRAQGWMGFFSEFSFINFCAFIICRRCEPTRRSLAVSWVFLVFAVLGFSFKLLPALALYPMTARRQPWQAWVGLAVLVCGLFFASVSGVLDSLIGVAAQKIGFYITNGNSARADSYRVMTESLMKGNMFGKGLGSFGGPASVKYASPLYSYYHFNWYGLGDVLKTTDTFYPHLFVELGLIGGILWLWVVFRYGTSGRCNRTWLFLAGVFCFDNAFSLALVSPSYVFAALLTMYLFRDGDVSIEKLR